MSVLRLVTGEACGAQVPVEVRANWSYLMLAGKAPKIPLAQACMRLDIPLDEEKATSFDLLKDLKCLNGRFFEILVFGICDTKSDTETHTLLMPIYNLHPTWSLKPRVRLIIVQPKMTSV